MAEIFTKEHIKGYVQKRKNELKAEIEKMTGTPYLTIMQVGDNPASNKYINGKINDCKEVGITPVHIKLSEDITPREFVRHLEEMDESTLSNAGIIVQKPLPESFSKCENYIFSHISESKDVDGFTVDTPYHPCTPKGIMDYLKYCKINLTGKHVVIVGRSELVGRPLAKMMLDADATVTVCHSKTRHLEAITRTADILVVAVGKSKMIDLTYIKDSTYVIDVGINVDENGKLCGDCDWDSITKIGAKCTPVPNGVGLLTRLALLENSVAVMNERYNYDYDKEFYGE